MARSPVPTRGNSTRRVGRIALAAALVALLAGTPTALAGPEEDGTSNTTNQIPSRASGPRRTSLGGSRVKAPRKIQGMPRKIPFAKHPHSMRNMKLRLGGVRSQAPRPISGLPRNNVPDLLPETSRQPAPETPTPTPRQGPTPEQIVAARLIEEAGGLRAPSRGALEIALRRSGFDDVEVGPRFRVDPGGADGQRMRDLQRLPDQLAGNPVLADAVRQQISSVVTDPEALEAARREYTSRGYTEIQLGPGDIGFVKTDNPETIRRIEQRSVHIRQEADRLDRSIRESRQRGDWTRWSRWINERVIDCDERCRRGAPLGAEPMVGDLDAFVRHGSELPPPTLAPGLEAALAAWDAGHFDVSAAELRDYLREAPDDMEFRRLLGLALLLDGQTPEGIEELAKAYETDPNLAARPLPPETFKGYESELRRAVSATVALAHRGRSHRPWLAASILMLAEGRAATAARMLDRAVKSGLPPEVETEMRLACEP